MFKQIINIFIAILIIATLSSCKDKVTPAQLAEEANSAFNSGDYGRAAWLFYNLKRQFEENANIHISLGFTYLKLGWPLYAGGEFSTALELTAKTNSLAWIGLGSAYAATNKWKYAILSYLHAAKFDPNNPDLYIKLANAFYYNENYDLAVKNYLHAVALGRKSAKLYLIIAKCYIKKEQWKKAVNTLELALNLDENNSEIIYRLMKIYRDNFNNIAKTKHYYALLQKVNPKLAQIEANAFKQKIQHALITNPYTRVTAKNNLIKKENLKKKRIKLEADRYEKLAQISVMNDLPKEALKYYKKALQTDKKRTYLYKKIAEIYDKYFNDFKPAIDFYSKYLDTCEKTSKEFETIIAKIKNLKIKYNQIEAEERAKRRKKELELKRKEEEKRKLLAEKQKKEIKLAKNSPQNYDEVIIEGVNYLKNNNFDKARSFFQKAITINPDYPNAYHNLGLVYYKQTNYNMAIKYFKSAIKKDAKFADSYLTLGLSYDKLHDKENAVENFTYYLELAPNTSYANWVNKWLTKNAGAR